MNKIAHTLLLAFIGAHLFAQQKPTPIHFDADAPDWAHLLLEESPNVRQIQDTYRDWFAERPFQKNRYTQFYKRWMHWARQYQHPALSI